MTERMLLKDLLMETRDGDWGIGSEADGYAPHFVIRGADFPNARRLAVESVPLRHLPIRTVYRRVLSPNDILIETAGGTRDRPTGRTLLVTKKLLDRFDHPVIGASFTRFLRADPKLVDPRYLFWYLQSIYAAGKTFEFQVQHTGVARFQYTTFAKSKHIPLPDRNLQCAIAETLGALDEKIAANNHLITSAEHLATTLFDAALKRRNRQWTYLDRIAKHKPGRYLPKSSYAPGGNYAVYGSNSVMGSHSEFLYEGPFMVLARIGSFCGNLRWSERAAWVNNNASAITPGPDIDPWILKHVLHTIDMGPHKAGSGQPFIKIESLMSTQVVLPEESECRSIAPLLQILSARQAAASEETVALSSARDRLLPLLVSGRVRVRDAERVGEVV